MKVIANNIEKQNAKLIMEKLMNCVKDKSIDAKTRNEYYAEYLKVSKTFLILSK